MSPVMILVRNKVVYVHLGEILEHGRLRITNAGGNKVFEEEIMRSHYKTITLDQPEGKYRIEINSEKVKIKKTFHLK